jgi:phytanoyl-CoA hydroxylase
MNALSDEDWKRYQTQGYLRLGKIISDEQLEQLQVRINEIMMGTAQCDYSRMMMQVDSNSGDYADLGSQGNGHQGATLNYRKIQDLELDPLFLEYLQHPIFHNICRRAYGHDAEIDIFRAMFMNKPAGRGTVLPWHQDRWRNLTQDPEVTVWTALDPATIENGCVQVIPGSHQHLLNPDHPSGFLTDSLTEKHCSTSSRVFLELEAGEVVLLHNWLLHSSDRNQSRHSRRAFSVCYMDAQTQTLPQGSNYPYRRAFGSGALCSKT